MENYIIYIVETGAVIFRGNGPVGAAAIQTPAEGMVCLKLSDGVAANVAESDPLYLKAALWAHTKAIRDRVIEAGAPTEFGIVDSDDLGRSNITGATVAAMAAITAEQEFEIEWTLRDNSYVVLDAMEMITLGTTTAAYVNSVHSRARALRNEINEATMTTDLLTIDILSGWPSCEPTQAITSPTE